MDAVSAVVVTVQVKVRLALTREQAQAYETASEAMRKLQGQHEQSASDGAQSLQQVVPLSNLSNHLALLPATASKRSVRVLAEHNPPLK